MTRLALALAVLATLAPIAGADALTFAPSEVIAAPSGLMTNVAWAPGEEVADSYRVYGLIEGQNPTLLLDTINTAAPVTFVALVPGGFPDYAVSGVLSGHESTLIRAHGPPCDVVIQTTPYPTLSTDCLRGEPFSYRRPA